MEKIKNPPQILFAITIFKIALMVVTLGFIFDLFERINLTQIYISSTRVIIFSSIKFFAYICFAVLSLFLCKGMSRLAEATYNFISDSSSTKRLNITKQFEQGEISNDEAKGKTQKIENEKEDFSFVLYTSKIIKFDTIFQIFLTLFLFGGGVVKCVYFLQNDLFVSIEIVTNISVLYGIIFTVQNILLAILCGMYCEKKQRFFQQKCRKRGIIYEYE